MAVARVRSNKENSQFYCTAFREIFQQYKEDHKDFDITNLKGIVLDWSDAERKGLEQAVGKEIAETLMIGCLVHYSRSYQRVAERVSSSLSIDIRNNYEQKDFLPNSPKDSFITVQIAGNENVWCLKRKSLFK